MLSSTMTPTAPARRPVLSQLKSEIYSDGRYGTQGEALRSSNVRMPRVASHNGAYIAVNHDGTRCVVAGNCCLRILRVSSSATVPDPEPKHTIGPGGYRIDASRNLWDPSALEGVTTDVVWCNGQYHNKIMTSTRNGDILLWDVNKPFSAKFERKFEGHTRSINILASSRVVDQYVVSGSADGDVRVWDLRDTKCILTLHHPAAAVRSASLSPSKWNPLQTVVGLDNGSLYRWDLRGGRKGLLDRIPMAHSGPILAIDWRDSPDVRSGLVPSSPTSGQGWIATGGIDRTVKIWDLTAPGTPTHIPHTPSYTLHSSFPIRRLQWRPDYDCELVIVSNAETGTINGETGGSTSSKRRSGSRTRVSSLTQPTPTPTASGEETPARNTKGDAIEIWDVRRPFLAKWALLGSSIEGGVTDIDFNGPDSLLVQHSSGAFCQLDVRESVKPIDFIPRCAATWDAAGSMVFATDRPAKWEVPYDDIAPERKELFLQQKGKIKTMNNPVHVPYTQVLGSWSGNYAEDDLDVFCKTARSSVVDGADRTSACTKNAFIAELLGSHQEAQTWMRLACLLQDLVPVLPPAPAPPPTPLLPNPHHRMPAISAQRSAGLANENPIGLGRPPAVSSIHSSQTKNRRLTPTSSNSSSPYPGGSQLPPPTPRQPSVFSRRDSDVGRFSRPSNLDRRHSLFSTPSDGLRASSSLRHVGEGALDDSDESDEDMAMDTEEDALPSSGFLRESSVSSPLAAMHPPELAYAQAEDEEEGSPSPRSTDSDLSDFSSSPRKRVQLPRRRSSAVGTKSRSRSSTVASFAASSIQRQVTAQISHSSMRTVIAVDEAEEDQRILQRDETAQDLRRPGMDNSNVPTPSSAGLRADPQTHPLALSMPIPNLCSPVTKAARDAKTYDRKRFELIAAEEEGIRQQGWALLCEEFEAYADEGDVQMCTLMALVAPAELKLGEARVSRFLDSYIEILKRLRLYTSIAYLRKQSTLESVRAPTKMETVIYTSCGRCRRPIVNASQTVRGAFSFCADCKSQVVACSICHLPVRSLLVQCSVCMHGGHQQCYQMYYMKRPMLDATKETPPHATSARPLAPSPSFGSYTSSASDSSSTVKSAVDLSTDEEAGPSNDTDVEEDRPAPQLKSRLASLQGHPCASGCGHLCWAASNLFG